MIDTHPESKKVAGAPTPRSLMIALMAGGPSAEREVSLKSAVGVSRALRNLGHRVIEIDPKDENWSVPEGVDVVCLMPLHGTYGEDGTIQQILERRGLAYTGCGAEASRIAFDKLATKEKMIAAEIPTARFQVFDSPDAGFPGGWNFPVVLKPVCQGSSVGLQFVDSIDQWSGALRKSLQFDTRVLMEQKIEGRETTVGILENRALPVVEIRPRAGSYDFQNKYTPGATEYFCPADFSPEITASIQQAAMGAYHSIGGRDYARVDVMVDVGGKPVVLEVNTLPGMTETSLMPKAAAAAGISYEELCQKIMLLAMERTV